MFKKVLKGFLASCLLVSGFVLVPQQIRAAQIEPRAMIINREIDTYRDLEVYVGSQKVQLARVFFKGTYTHNVTTSKEFPTNLNVNVYVERNVSFPTNGKYGDAGLYTFRLDPPTFSAANKMLVVSFSMVVHQTGTQNGEVLFFDVKL